MLDIKDIHVYYDGIHAIKGGVSMTVPQGGALVTLVGSNGGAGGKTTSC